MTYPSIPETKNPSMFPLALFVLEIMKEESIRRPPKVDPAIKLALLPLVTNPMRPPAKVNPPTAVLRTIPLGAAGSLSGLLMDRLDESSLLSIFRGIINRFLVVLENAMGRTSKAFACCRGSRARSMVIPRRNAGLNIDRQCMALTL